MPNGEDGGGPRLKLPLPGGRSGPVAPRPEPTGLEAPMGAKRLGGLFDDAAPIPVEPGKARDRPTPLPPPGLPSRPKWPYLAVLGVLVLGVTVALAWPEPTVPLPTTPVYDAPLPKVATGGARLPLIHVRSTPAGARVFVEDEPQIDADGKPLVTPTTLSSVEFEKSYAIRLELDGHEPWSDSVTVRKGAKSPRVKAQLLERKAEVFVTVSPTYPGERVVITVNGFEVAEGRSSVFRRRPGPVTVTAGVEGFECTVSKDVEIKADAYNKVALELPCEAFEAAQQKASSPSGDNNGARRVERTKPIMMNKDTSSRAARLRKKALIEEQRRLRRFEEIRKQRSRRIGSGSGN